MSQSSELIVSLKRVTEKKTVPLKVILTKEFILFKRGLEVYLFESPVYSSLLTDEIFNC